MHADNACDAGNLVRLFRRRPLPRRRPQSVRPSVHGNSDWERDSKFIPGTMFQGVQL